MRLKVDLLPRGPYGDAVLLVDVLRATTTIPVLFDRGIEGLFVTPSLKGARTFAAEGGHLLVGERDGLPPEGFNYGNSPADLNKVDFRGRTAVLTSQNGPRTLPVLSGARIVLLGSFYNARAAADAVLRLARDEIAVVCAGHDGNESLEDTLAAGFLARRVQRAAEAAGREGLELRDAARLATALLRAFPDPQEALVQSTAGGILRQLNLNEDLAFASLISQTDIVPVLREVVPWDPEPVYRFEALRPHELG